MPDVKMENKTWQIVKVENKMRLESGGENKTLPDMVEEN